MTFDRAAAKARAGAADEGPWGTKCRSKYCSPTFHCQHEIRNDRDYKNGEPFHEDGSIGHLIAEISGGGMHHKGNADFIAAARTDLPLALAELDEKDEMIRELAGVVKACRPASLVLIEMCERASLHNGAATSEDLFQLIDAALARVPENLKAVRP